jgi:type I restriction enzyme S subunit
MNPAQLLENFDRIAEAPGSISDLRALIIHLGVTGKLLQHEDQGISGKDYYQKIQDGITRLASGCNRCRWAASSQISSKDIPYIIPNHWTWARINDTGLYINGIAFKPTDWKNAGLPIIRIQNLSDETKGFNYVEGSFADENMIQNGELLVSWSATLDAFLWHRGSGVLNQHIFKVIINEDAVARNYLFWLLKHEIKSLAASDHAHGLAMKHINRGPFLAHVVPLPPLAEQYRIVAKIDELMVLCDQLQTAQNERETRRGKLVTSSLHQIQIQNGITPVFLDHIQRLTTRPEHIKQLRQTILSLAVRGRLIPQDSNDEPAVKLLAHIKLQRDQLLNSGYPNADEAKSQCRKQALQIVPSGLSGLPAGWQWATLIQCSTLVVDCHNKTAPYSKVGIPLIRTTNVRDGKLNLNEPKFVDDATYARWSARCEPEPGDILITREAPMGEVAVIPEGMKICLGQRMMLARLVPKTIDPKFMLYSLRDPLLMDRVQDKPVGATVQHLRVGGVETLLVPLPPLAEQHRIVAKVDELMMLCDKLEFQLNATQTDSRRLLEAILYDALNPAMEEVTA